jgi:uncharacterized protein with ParB-like and HNH nuclease domain/predicted transport protein
MFVRHKHPEIHRMKASECRLLDLLARAPQFVIPIYQRTYSWTERECRQLWADVMRCGRDEHVVVHFVGSIVYIESGLSQVSVRQPYLVIDGQQRLTTISLLLAALADAVGDEAPLDGFSRRKIRRNYLIDSDEDGDRRYKLLLSQTDRDTLAALVDERELPTEHSIRIVENHKLFVRWLAETNDLLTICRGLSKLVVVDIALDRSTDNPQLIFESMNSTGLELSQADLIRNYVLMRMEPALQTRLYQEYWRPMELEFGQVAYSESFDAFMRHYLTMRTGEIPNIGNVYEAFKHLAQNSQQEMPAATHIEALVRDLRRFARFYCAMVLGGEQDPDLGTAFEDLRELRVDVAWPLLLKLYDSCEKNIVTRGDFIKAVRMVESYVLRRAVCDLSAQGSNKLFAELVRQVNVDRALESLQARFLLMQGARRFPRDEEFERKLQERDLYSLRIRSYLLRRLENHNRKERVEIERYTIEHILPQNENLNQMWRSDLGENWKEIQAKYLHTLGNLTLTGYNSEYSDRSFTAKRDMEGGFRDSPLYLNKGLGKVEVWNEDAIIERASRLSLMAQQIWPVPVLDADTLEAYRPKASRQNGYSLDDHPHLSRPAIRDLFDALRREVLALDPSVTEEVLKRYIAYKFDTNFVDVVPQAWRLRLELNMPFHEIHDPRGICEDVSGKGHLGNGDVELSFASREDLPYVMGLVRQSFERQL